MTHEELLAKIDAKFPFGFEGTYFNKTYKALRAVVELHKPFVRDDMIVCNLACNDEGGYLEHYPCQTIQAIEKELQ